MSGRKPSRPGMHPPGGDANGAYLVVLALAFGALFIAIVSLLLGGEG